MQILELCELQKQLVNEKSQQGSGDSAPYIRISDPHKNQMYLAAI
jgi:hypothetical protein